MNILRLSLSALLASKLLTIAAQSTTPLSNVFTVTTTCNNFQALTDMLAETILLGNTAITTLNTLIAGKWKGGDLVFNRQLRGFIIAANTAWGTPLLNAFNPSYSPADIAQLQAALNNFQEMINVVQQNLGVQPARNFFWCNPSTFQYTTSSQDLYVSTSPVPLGPSGDPETVSEKYKNPGISGAWVDPDPAHILGPTYNYLLNWGPKMGPCDEPVIGIVYGQRNMFICPIAFDPQYFAQSVKPFQGFTGKATWRDAWSLPAVFLHEMMHWIRVRPHIEDIQIPIPGQSPIVAYGLMAARQLSNNPATQHQALINADSYAVFATMAWMPRTTWTG